MRSAVNIEVLFAWILISGNEFFTNYRRLANAENIEYYSDEDPEYHRNIAALNCNCSWGSVPGDDVMGRIVGGRKVSAAENYPMIVGLQTINQYCVFCGASILTEYHVLTAAHCVFDEDLTTIVISAGVKGSCRDSYDGGLYVGLQNPPYIHEKYNPRTNFYDIAIVLTQHRIKFNNVIGPTCIYTKPVEERSPILVLGWGRMGETLGTSRFMMKVILNHMPIAECKKKLPRVLISPNLTVQLCTIGEKKDACMGDSGGPLFVLDKSVNRLAQVAIVSMGKGCARPKTPGVNTALYPYLGWIEYIIRKSMSNHHPSETVNDGETFCYAS